MTIGADAIYGASQSDTAGATVGNILEQHSDDKSAIDSKAPDRGTKKLATIEVGRGIAATLVVLYHAARHLNKNHGTPFLTHTFQFGHAGVDFFFVISGFIILFVHYADIGRNDRLGHYVQRRFTRLMPTYWVALGATIALSIAGTHALPSFKHFIFSLLLLPSDREPILGIAWTLQHEVMFYAAFSILIFNRKMGIAALAIWAGAVAAATTASWHQSILPNSIFSAFNLEFFLGMAAAWWVQNFAVRKSLVILCAGLALFLLAGVLEDVGILDGYSTLARFAYGVPATLLVVGAATVNRKRSMRIPDILRACGSASYSIYLFQFVFIGLAWKSLVLFNLTSHLLQGIEFVLLSSCAILGGIFISKMVEYPLIEYSRRSTRRIFSIAGSTPAV